MAQRPDLSRYLDAGTQFVALTRAQARARAAELVGQGQLAQEQVQGFVDDLVEESRRRTDEMLDVVRREIPPQLKTRGIATKHDLARLESRIATDTSVKPESKAKKKATGKKSAAKKTTAKKSASKKTTAKKTTGKKKTTAKKTTAKKTTAKKTTAKTTTGKKSPRSRG
jgi:polyhydroxyalkanoate synthesis regulator phasin